MTSVEIKSLLSFYFLSKNLWTFLITFLNQAEYIKMVLPKTNKQKKKRRGTQNKAFWD